MRSSGPPIALSAAGFARYVFLVDDAIVRRALVGGVAGRAVEQFKDALGKVASVVFREQQAGHRGSLADRLGVLVLLEPGALTEFDPEIGAIVYHGFNQIDDLQLDGLVVDVGGFVL